MTNPHIPVILLVSRDRQLAYLIQRYTGNCGCKLIQTEYGINIFREIKKNHPDVILLDISQANADGRQALRELKAKAGTRFIPIILCATSELDWLDCEAEGGLLQPILFSDFINAIVEAGIQIPKNKKEV
jgi:CheY-like chemotaxis protein